MDLLLIEPHTLAFPMSRPLSISHRRQIHLAVGRLCSGVVIPLQLPSICWVRSLSLSYEALQSQTRNIELATKPRLVDVAIDWAVVDDCSEAEVVSRLRDVRAAGREDGLHDLLERSESVVVVRELSEGGGCLYL